MPAIKPGEIKNIRTARNYYGYQLLKGWDNVLEFARIEDHGYKRLLEKYCRGAHLTDLELNRFHSFEQTEFYKQNKAGFKELEKRFYAGHSFIKRKNKGLDARIIEFKREDPNEKRMDESSGRKG